MNKASFVNTNPGIFLVFIAAMLWASDAPFRVQLTDSLSSELIVFLEHAIALLILSPLLLQVIPEIKRLRLLQWLAVFFIGVGGSAVALFLFTESFTYMNPSVVIVLQKLQPLIAITLAVQILRERTGKRFWLWTLVALSSAYVITFPNLIPQFYQGEVFNPHLIGASLALAAAGLWGCSTVFGKLVLEEISFKAMTYLRFLIATIFLLGLNFQAGTFSEISTMAPTDWRNIVIISITSGVVAMYIYYRGLTTTKASVATIAELGFPVGAVLVNYYFLDATLSIVQVVAMSALLWSIYKLSTN